MRSLFVFLCGILIFLSKPAIADAYRVGIVEYPPHIRIDTSPPSGLVLEYVRKAMEKNMDSVSYSPLPLLRAITQLNSGQIDFLLTVEEPHGSIPTLDRPLFKLVPGLCFKKENFIPILSATHRFKELNIGYVSGVDVASPLQNSGASLVPLTGTTTMDRGLAMLAAGRIDAFYHPNPVFTYHSNNPLTKKIACSYFYGLTTNIFVAISPKLTEIQRSHIQSSFDNASNEQTYTDFYNTQLSKLE